LLFTGPVPKPAVAEAMRAATVLVAPSLTESFGIAPAEALACGVPVVASRTGALPELIDESSGLLVPPAQPAALADALETMLARHRQYDRAALAARVARFAPDAVADAWSALYADVTERSRPGT
jgi:glycosyltransferase involved in cell wall biosynthesis